MDKEISYIKLPNITTSKLQDVIDFLDNNEIEYVEYYAEDLQNRIDKAYEQLQLLHYNFPDYDEIHHRIQDIEDVLKESGV